ncbi:MAG: tRNAHis guanylyltransferase-domain-containing protein [Olpidium bornovanus]|uniref:tRNA(His) guanylyltransferase n=1 Tax=Olpidium bornovanus TaxID=278681 RepID=A0A8H7ZX79_9FUNG|nr:MAG: tRNAHis guanylyltransferase-domain-containing protein [Olpidium bornovanus]
MEKGGGAGGLQGRRQRPPPNNKIQETKMLFSSSRRAAILARLQCWQAPLARAARTAPPAATAVSAGPAPATPGRRRNPPVRFLGGAAAEAAHPASDADGGEPAAPPQTPPPGGAASPPAVDGPPRTPRPAFLSDVAAMDELGDRIKALESVTTSVRFPPTAHFCVRLDGVGFHQLPQGFFKPFDERLLDAMMFTARDVLEKYDAASLAYVESDEITLLFPSRLTATEDGDPDPLPVGLATGDAEALEELWEEEQDGANPAAAAPGKCPKKEAAKRANLRRRKRAMALAMARGEEKLDDYGFTHPYGGRVFKLLSTTAAYAATRFNHHLSSLCKDVPVRERHVAPPPAYAEGQARPTTHDYLAPLTESTLRKARSHTAMFDSRAFEVPDLATLADCVYWRSSHDCIRNAVNGLARSQFSHRRLNGVPLRRAIEMLAAERGIDPETHLRPRAMFGTFIKRHWCEVRPEDLAGTVTNEPPGVPVYRTQIKCAPVNWKDWTPEARSKFAAAKYWPAQGVPGEFPAHGAPATVFFGKRGFILRILRYSVDYDNAPQFPYENRYLPATGRRGSWPRFSPSDGDSRKTGVTSEQQAGQRVARREILVVQYGHSQCSGSSGNLNVKNAFDTAEPNRRPAGAAGKPGGPSLHGEAHCEKGTELPHELSDVYGNLEWGVEAPFQPPRRKFVRIFLLFDERLSPEGQPPPLPSAHRPVCHGVVERLVRTSSVAPRVLSRPEDDEFVHDLRP